MLRIALKGILARKRRLILTSLVIVVGVAFISGTAVLSDVLTRSADRLVADIFQGIDSTVRSTIEQDNAFGPDSTRDAVDESLLDQISAVDGVKVAVGSATSQAVLIGQDGKASGGFGPPTIVTNWSVDGVGGGTLTEGREPTGSDEVVIDFKTAEDEGFAIGDDVTVQVPSVGAATFEIVGVGGLGAEGDQSTGSKVLLVDVERAQEIAGLDAQFNSIDVAGDGSASQEELTERINEILPNDTEAISGDALIEEQQAEIGQILSIITTLISVFGYLAAFVAVFVIYNVFSITIAQRTREIALMRAVGAGRGQVLGSVMLEAVAMGLIAAVIGLFAGYGLAVLLKGALGGFLTISDGLPRLTSSAIVTSLVIGLLTTIISAIVPAYRSTRVPPVAALGEVAFERGTISMSRRIIGPGLLLGGALLIILGVQGVLSNALLGVGLGGAMVFVSLVVVGPMFAGPVSKVLGAPLPSIAGTTGRIARDNAARNPKRTTATGVALTIGVSLVTLITVIAASFTGTFSDAFENQLDADIIVDAAGGGTGFAYMPFEAVDQIAEVEGVGIVSPVAFTGATVFNSVNGKEAIAEATEEDGVVGEQWALYGVEPEALFATNDLGDVTPGPEGLTDDTVAIRQTTLDENNWEIGDEIEMFFATTGAKTLPIGAVYEKSSFGPTGTGPEAMVSRQTYEAVVAPEFQGANNVFIKIDQGADVEAVVVDVEDTIAAAAPAASAQDIGTFVEEQKERLQGFLNIIYVLLALAVIVAIIGIAITMSLSVFERTREIGLLRAVGMERKQVRRAVRWEAAIIGLFGTGLGLVAGVLLAMAVVSAMSGDGIILSIPIPNLIVIVVGGALAGIIAAIFPARKAARLDILDALATT
jgi:putative ABC transport system permease protein